VDPKFPAKKIAAGKFFLIAGDLVALENEPVAQGGW
jgi:hypothetical protein